MKRPSWLALWTALALALFGVASGCASAPQLHGQIAGLEEVAAQAERNGAIRCAPRELATARANIEFAKVELAQGSISGAKRHLGIAAPNVTAAKLLSPPEYCAERAIVEIEPGDPDTDGDGIPDSTDYCVLEPEDADNYLDQDGCPDPDNDLDGILDGSDNCPLEPEDPDGYEDQDGCPDLDNDRDQVPDLKDQCPNEIGSTEQEPLGCPAKPALAVVTDCEVKIKQQVHFEYNKARIRPESYPVLNAVAEVLEANPDIKLEVQGHTDNRGSASYNQGLSERRAASVQKYLASQGIDPLRLTSRGYGFDRPIVANDSDQNRALNRRVQFVRTEGQKEGCPKTGE